MNLLKLNTRQSIFASVFMVIIVIISSYLTPWNINKVLYIAHIAVVSSFVGSLIAKKSLKTN